MKISINLGPTVGKVQTHDALQELFDQCMEAVRELHAVTGNIEVILLSPISGPGMPAFEGRLVMSFFSDTKYEEKFYADLEGSGARKAIIDTATLILGRFSNDCEDKLRRADALLEQIPAN